jgi:hypothetical protein
MIITGDLLIKDGSMHQAMQACQKHVAHSRTKQVVLAMQCNKILVMPYVCFFVNNGKIPKHRCTFCFT